MDSNTNIPAGLAEVLARLRGEPTPAPSPPSNSNQGDQAQNNQFPLNYASSNGIDAASQYGYTGYKTLHDAYNVNGSLPPQSTYNYNDVSISGHYSDHLHAQYAAQERAVIIDPASITEWASGLRCVSKLAAQNAAFAEGIKHMIQEQMKHEKQWYSERLAVKMQAASRKKAEFHPSVGPTAHLVLEPREPEETLSSEDQLQFELAAFDRKVLAAQTAMQQHMTGKLKRMGVPFFGTQPDLVVPEASATSANRPKWSPLITGAQLRELQMRMIQHLEDMYKD